MSCRDHAERGPTLDARLRLRIGKSGNLFILSHQALGTVSVLQIRGPSDQRSHPVRVWRPPGPDSATIPVLYFLHGYPGSAGDPFTAGLHTTTNFCADFLAATSA